MSLLSKRKKIDSPKQKISNATEKAKTSFSTIADEYMHKLVVIGRPLSCVVTVENAIPTGNFEMMSIKDTRETVSYERENQSVGYKTLSHMLIAGNDKYGLCCTSDGDVELYEISNQGKVQARLVSKTDVSTHIVDPMMAFISGSGIYIVFNDPTTLAIESGYNLRKPVFSEDDGVIAASGAPIAYRFDLLTCEVKSLLPKIEKVARYGTSLIDDPDGSLPLLLLANVLTPEPEEETGLTLKSLFKVFGNDKASDILEQEQKKFPIGISVSSLYDAERFQQIPMSGHSGLGIKKVALTRSADGETNDIRVEEEDENSRLVNEILDEQGNREEEIGFDQQKTEVMPKITANEA